MSANIITIARWVCVSTLLWPTALLSQDVTDQELDALCTRVGDLAYFAASKREAGEDLEDVKAMVVQIMSDASDGKVNKSVAIKMVSALSLAQLPESGSKEEVSQWVYGNCMTTDWIEAD